MIQKVKHAIRITILLIETRLQNLILKKPVIINDVMTLETIIQNKCSVARFGDGEIALVNHEHIKFQKRNDKLSERLNEVLRSNEPGMMVCIPDIFKISSLKYLTYDSKVFWLNELIKNRKIWYNIPKKNKVYYDACITRPYIRNENKQHSKQLFDLLKQVWENKEIVIVEGIHSRLGLGNDLFASCKKIERILCPKKDAFEKYDEILNCVLEKVDHEKLVLISLGPTATVLAYDLFKEGYQAIDLGHIDLEYEWFLRNATERILIENKEVNELSEENEIRDVEDCNYQQQILAEIR